MIGTAQGKEVARPDQRPANLYEGSFLRRLL